MLSWLALAASLTFLGAAPSAHAERVKDIASVAGVRSNQLVGYGLVVGLDGTGDQTSQAPFTIQSIRNMLAKFGVTIPANVNPQLKNVAAVVVTADLPPFTKTGQTIDITVASIGNAGSLRGGSLLMTPMRGIDGDCFARRIGGPRVELQLQPQTVAIMDQPACGHCAGVWRHRISAAFRCSRIADQHGCQIRIGHTHDLGRCRPTLT